MNSFVRLKEDLCDTGKELLLKARNIALIDKNKEFTEFGMHVTWCKVCLKKFKEKLEKDEIK